MKETYCMHVKQLKLNGANIFNYLTAKGVVRLICKITLSIYQVFHLVHPSLWRWKCQELICLVVLARTSTDQSCCLIHLGCIFLLLPVLQYGQCEPFVWWTRYGDGPENHIPQHFLSHGQRTNALAPLPPPSGQLRSDGCPHKET